MKRLLQSLFLLAALAAQMALAGPERLPVGDFFKDPEFTSVSLSPTGEYITVSVPQGDRTVLAAFKVDGMKLVGKWDYGERRHIDRVVWVTEDRFLMYVSRKTGRFDFRVATADVYASNVDGTQRADMPNLGFYQIVDVTWDDPRTILVQRSIDSAFLSKYDVYDGRVTTVATAPLRFGNFIVNSKGEPRYVVGQDEKNNLITMRRDGDAWIQVHRDEMGGDRRVPLGFDGGDESKVVFEVSRGGKPATVVLVNPETGEETPLSHNPNVEPGGFLQSSGDNPELLAIRYFDGLPSYDFVKKDHPESKVYAGLINAFPDRSVSFAGISKDGRLVLLRTFSDRDPGSYFLFDRKTNQAKYLLSAMSWIDPEKMASMQPFSFKARDGRTIHGYITLPPDSDGGPLPMILHPHGGPHGPRDMWGFNPEVQFLANRGYAVLQVNFRGSGGYGSEFERAGYRNWGTAMIDDMTDAVDWAIARGIADKDRICTYGASYGGYAALQSVVRNPDKYRCTIGYVGVYSLPLMFKDGDIPDSESGRNYLERVLPVDLAEQQRQSPAFNVDRIRIPVMLVHGGKDERVPMSQYRLLKKNLEQAGRPPEVTVVEDKEGHGFYDYDNQVELYTAMEAFLDKHIGGKSN